MKLSDHASLSFGGSVRLQGESFINESFIEESNHDNFWFLERTLLHAHFKAGWFEVFAELNSSLVAGKEDITPVDEDQLSVNQAFLKFHFNDRLYVLLGRENLRLGSRRLVDIREGPNVRRSFDLVKMGYTSEKLETIAFFSIVVQPNPDIFDNTSSAFDETFSGLYTTLNITKSLGIDSYFLYQKQNNVTYNNGIGDERRSSLVVRTFGTYKSLSFNNEFVYQFGTLDNQRISAWTLSFHLENKTPIASQDFNIGLKTELISGDKDSNDTTLNTFDALYPRGAYFGRVARFGPSNLIDLHPYMNTSIGKLFLEVDYDIFWRYSTADGIYNPALLLDYPDVNDERFIAHQLGTLIGYEINPHVAFELETNFIFPGSFLKESGLSQNLFHFVLTSEIRF